MSWFKKAIPQKPEAPTPWRYYLHDRCINGHKYHACPRPAMLEVKPLICEKCGEVAHPSVFRRRVIEYKWEKYISRRGGVYLGWMEKYEDEFVRFLENRDSLLVELT